LSTKYFLISAVDLGAELDVNYYVAEIWKLPISRLFLSISSSIKCKNGQNGICGVKTVTLQGTMLHIPTKQMLHSVVYIDIIKRKATESHYAKMCLQQNKSDYNYIHSCAKTGEFIATEHR